MAKSVNKLEKLRFPHPEEVARKFKVGKRFTPNNVSKEQQTEKNKTLNPPGVSKPHKIGARNKELMGVIFEAAKAHTPDVAFEAYQRMSAIPDVKGFTALIKSCENNGDYIGEAFEIYQDAKKINISFNTALYHTLLKCCVSANHWQRAMFCLKEFLVHVPLPKKPDRQIMNFFTTLLKLLYRNNLHDRILFVYQVMVKHKILPRPLESTSNDTQVSTDASDSIKDADNTDDAQANVNAQEEQFDEDEVILRGIPLSFVTMFAPREEAAQTHQVLNELLTLSQPHGDCIGALVPRSKSETRQQFDDTVHKSMQQSAFFAYAQKVRQHGAAREYNFESAHDTISREITTHNSYNPHPGVDRIIKETLADMQNECVRLTNKLILANDDAPLSPKEAIQEEAARAFFSKFWIAETDQEKKAAFAEYEAAKKLRMDERRTKITWSPIVIGIDSKPFFPKSISRHLITDETISAAKQEYIDSITDAKVREEITSNNDLRKRIKLCWYNYTTGEMVEGLFY